MKKETRIDQYMLRKKLTQKALAELLGFKTQSAISQMLMADREIYIRNKDGGGIEAFEIKIIDGRKRKGNSAA